MATQTQPTRRKRPAPGGNGRMIALLISVVLVLAVTFVLVNTLVDLLYAAVDPRVKYD